MVTTGAAADAVRRSDRRRAYRHSIPVLVSISAAAMLAGLAFLAFPGIVDGSALGSSLPFLLERGWALAYMLGGLLILIGIQRLDARFEVAGLLLLSGCYFAYGYAIFDQRGFAPGAVGAPVFIGLAVGCTARAFILRFEPERAPWRRRKS
jgi:drug/metabolite transporter (DMT)-like permease